MKYSIIIRSYNESRHLPALLEAIAGQSIPAQEREVVLVDSGSTDRTVEIAEHHNCRIVRISQSEFSFGRSLNVGCEAAAGNMLVFISGHCVPVEPDWLEHLTRPLQSGADLTYGRQIGGPGTKFSENQLFRKHFPPEDGERPHPFFCNNANSAVRRDCWSLYRFDETLTGLEDMLMGRRVLQGGGTICYVPDAPVYHHHDETWLRVKLRYEREAIALQHILPEIHVHLIDALRYFFAGVLSDWSTGLVQRVFWKTAGSVLLFRFCQYYGTWRGNHLHRKLSRESKERYFYPR